MRYRRRLRSRIVISFALFGLGLTALFAAATIYMRTRLEDQLINNNLQRQLRNFVEFKREHPEQEAIWRVSQYDASIFSERKFGNVPFAYKNYENGVFDIDDVGEEGKLRPFKLAAYKDPNYWAFLRFDVSAQKLNERQLLVILGASVFVFAIMSIVIGFWLSARVMSPVTDLARRVLAMSQTGRPQPLKAHFANDEVGQVASALDDYSTRLTELVERDREFNADVSHELRTPLAVIASTTELLQGSPDLTDKLRERLKRIERAVRQSTELTDALLLLSRRERQAPTDGDATDVVRVVEQVVDVQRPHLGNKPVQVRVEVEEPLATAAPSSVVSVAIGNLIGNAFKYTQAGEVVVTVGHGRVAVEDTGPGIAPEDAEKLFERGVRGTSAGKGAGLGLAIVRRLCELYGWRVVLAPRPQGGAVATLEFERPGHRA